MTNTTCNAGSTIKTPSIQGTQPHQTAPDQQDPNPDASNTNRTTALRDRVRRSLVYLYQDVTRLRSVAAPSIVLHPADRALTNPPRAPLVGIGAAQRHEEALVAATGKTLVMEVESITVGEGWEGGGEGEGEGEGDGNGGGMFACVMGVLRAGKGGDPNVSTVLTKEQQQQQQQRGDGVTGRDRGKIAVPFCGVWRFDGEGNAVEHWENAADPGALARWLRGE